MRYLVLLALIVSQPVFSEDLHPVEEIVVTAHPLGDGDIVQSHTSLTGDKLNENLAASIGETVANEVGINSASFGTAVGRPVIHGLGGARVKTTEDRIDTLDVSVTSGDHAVGVEPFIANQISILKGSSTLLYGSGAIGGVVDVDTGRIPNDSITEAFSGRAEFRISDVDDGTMGAFRLDGRASDNFAWHIDAFSRDADDYKIPSPAESRRFMLQEEEEEHHHDEDHDEDEHHDEDGDEHHDEDEHHDDDHDEHGEEEDTGYLEGSRSKSKGGAIGFSFIGESGFIGMSVSKIDSDYGLVGGHDHEHGHGHEDEDHDEDHDEEEHHDEDHDEHEHGDEEEGVGMIALEQTRTDLEAQLNDPFSGIQSINFRIGFNDYEHNEIEGNGEVGTLFKNDAWESRLELKHDSIFGFNGSFGIQAGDRDFSALGEEAFVEPVSSKNFGAFWVGEKKFENIDLQAGLRVGNQKHQPKANNGTDRKFSTFSASIGANFKLSSDFTVSALFDQSSRAPTIEELYSNGAHLATSSYEIGDLNLVEEEAQSLTLSADYHTDLVDVAATVYRMNFNDFIYEIATGEEIDELPVLRFRQDDADFTGFDLSTMFHVAKFDNGDLDFGFNLDSVKAKTKGNGNLPRIPANSAAASIRWTAADWSAKIRYKYVAEQDRVAAFELATDSYKDLAIYLNRKIELENAQLELYLHGKNLLDEEQRHHSSIVKDLAPAPGRRLEIGLRARF